MRPDPSYGLSGSAEAFDVAEQLGRVHQLDVLCVQSALRAVPASSRTACCCSSTSRPTRSTSTPRATTGCARRSKAAGLLAVAGRDRGHRALRRAHRGGRQVPAAAARAGLSRPHWTTSARATRAWRCCARSTPSSSSSTPAIVIAAPTDPSARAVLLAMATFARQTGSFVIAEGVEDEETLQFLRSIDVHDLHVDTIIQGGQGGELGSPSPVMPPVSHAAARSPSGRLVGCLAGPAALRGRWTSGARLGRSTRPACDSTRATEDAARLIG